MIMKDGGPAFPCVKVEKVEGTTMPDGTFYPYIKGSSCASSIRDITRCFEGMTLRAFFASQAQAAWIQALSLRRGEPGYSDDSAASEAARLADISADALICELDRE